MYARLAFSTTLQIEPDILLVDEVLSVGDLHFQEKSYKAFSSILKNEKSVVIVSHNLNTLNELCDRVLFLNKGKIQSLGKPDEVISQYTKMIEEINQVIMKKKIIFFGISGLKGSKIAKKSIDKFE